MNFMNKVIDTIQMAIEQSGLRDGMTVSFHHHLRNGDHIVNLVLDIIEAMGIRDIKINMSSIFDVHYPLVEHIMFGGSFMRVLNPELANPDTAVIEFVKLYPPIVSTILTIALMSALMSTACGLLIVMSTCISTDIFKKTLVKHGVIKMSAEKAEKTSLVLMRVLPFVISAVCVYLVLYPPTFMGNMVWIGISAVASSTLAPLIVSIFLPRFKSTAAAICGAVCGFGFYAVIHLITGIERSVMAAGAWGLVVSFIVMLVVGYFTGNKNTIKEKEV